MSNTVFAAALSYCIIKLFTLAIDQGNIPMIALWLFLLITLYLSSKKSVGGVLVKEMKGNENYNQPRR